MDPRSESAIFSELRQIAATPGFAHILAYVCIRDNYIWYSDTLTLDDMAHLYTRERLIRTELQLLIGLMIQAAPDFAAPPPEDAAFILSQAEALLEELHLAMGLAPLEPGEERSIETFQRWSGSADIFALAEDVAWDDRNNRAWLAAKHHRAFAFGRCYRFAVKRPQTTRQIFRSGEGASQLECVHRKFAIATSAKEFRAAGIDDAVRRRRARGDADY